MKIETLNNEPLNGFYTIRLIFSFSFFCGILIIIKCFSKHNGKDFSRMRDDLSEMYKVKVGDIFDGDTFQAWDRGEKSTIRLLGIDCPEDGQEWGDMATAGLIKLIGGSGYVYLEIFGKDIYGRKLAIIYIKSKTGEIINVNEKMILKGHAWVTKIFKELPYERQVQFNRLENWAKRKRVGLWASNNPIPPWLWRKKK